MGKGKSRNEGVKMAHKKPVGWKNKKPDDSFRHAQAARGIETVIPELPHEPGIPEWFQDPEGVMEYPVEHIDAEFRDRVLMHIGPQSKDYLADFWAGLLDTWEDKLYGEPWETRRGWHSIAKELDGFATRADLGLANVKRLAKFARELRDIGNHYWSGEAP